MRLLHLVLTTVVALVSVSNGITTSAKTVMGSDSIYAVELKGQIATRELRGAAFVPAMMPRRPDSSPTEAPPTPTPAPLPPGVYLGEKFGGPHGKDFTDGGMVKSGQKVLSINLRAAERIDAVILTVVSPSGEEATFFHGGGGGDLKIPLALAEGEYITTMEAHSGKHKEHTRITYIKFTTNKGNFIEGGTRTDNNGTDTAKEGYQLSGFVGRSGDELDMVGAIWTSIQSVV